jgi:uncharacterized protein
MRHAHMRCHATIVTLFAMVLCMAFCAASPARAQTPPQSPAAQSPESLAAAHELMGVIKPANQFKAVLPALIQSMKSTLVQGRPELEKQYDAMMPAFYESAQKRFNELADSIAVIYASNFTADELRDIIAFYRTPTGQTLLARQATIAQQTMTMGQQFGRSVANDVQQQMSGHAN